MFFLPLWLAAPQVGVDSPGPSYDIPAALGKQQLSTKRSAGAFVMPRGQRFVDCDVREAAQKVRSRAAAQAARCGHLDRGPNACPETSQAWCSLCVLPSRGRWDLTTCTAKLSPFLLGMIKRTICVRPAAARRGGLHCAVHHWGWARRRGVFGRA